MGPAAQAINDSEYYLIDYINSDSGYTLERTSGGMSHAAQAPTQPALPPAARRIVNKSTRARQTQYEYNFGSQIFECLDKDLLLLKTDAFKEFETRLGMFSTDTGESIGGGGGSSAINPVSDWMQGSSKGNDAASMVSAASGSGGRNNRKQQRSVDVTKATAYTAAALNRIVAHNTKARSTVVSTAASATTGNTSQLSRQLII
ncbi:hypothetical protein LPJ66_007755 [Kickxella alabastrina]|uniref:Uncharacterized protein n=1 Tax=Kickxella alabastrina TaxID=61397 RepID=A0ACC1I8L1_9FUNG|nr:hypothetical protein LPJ66_007755 [Kickxella alabastrina]